MEEEQVIQLHFSRGNIFVWNSRDVRLLRDTHHIVGALTGSLPRAPRQNNQLGLPLKLMPEEAFALITYGVAKLMRLNLPHYSQHDITTFQEARKESFEKQKSIYLEQMQAKENIYRNSKQSQLSKKKKRKQKQMKKYEKEKLETLQATETVPENPDGRVGGAGTCDWEAGARDDSKLVKDMNVAHRDWFPIVEKSSSKDATDQCILGDSSQAREGLDEMDIDGNSKLWSDRRVLQPIQTSQQVSHYIFR
ncbi:putative tRNA-splicing endonuclease subunit Sen34 [Apostichopus japonicus]|uniref:Putative tRNA-splicing endonuclease subunit Sen34 n=1 Tax=Stichopus japonicus TaxID=307972 RepID=A0A2G8JS13_STIJA|nr:putative tRNA-splicing endonuclease subunit Sen34 [Apostichopus japonicus]